MNFKDRSDNLEQMIKQIWWMARRYADGRSTSAPSIVNQIYDKCQKMNVDLGDDDGKKYADDGNFGIWIPEKQTFEKELRIKALDELIALSEELGFYD